MAKDQNNVDPFFESLKFAIASVTRDDARQALSKTQKLSKLSSHPQTRLMGLISESVQNLPLPIRSTRDSVYSWPYPYAPDRTVLLRPCWPLSSAPYKAIVFNIIIGQQFGQIEV